MAQNDNEKIDISPSNDGGVLKEIIKEGTGTEKPTPGSKVRVHYVGTLTDGTPFDSSRTRGEPFEFTLGKGKSTCFCRFHLLLNSNYYSGRKCHQSMGYRCGHYVKR